MTLVRLSLHSEEARVETKEYSADMRRCVSPHEEVSNALFMRFRSSHFFLRETADFLMQVYMQTKAQKEQLVAEVGQRIKDAKALVFIDCKGLTVKELTTLKRSLGVSDSTLLVLKKTLLNIALEQANVAVNARALEGQVAVAFSSDEVSAAKATVDFAKSFKDKSILVGGSLGAKALTVAEVKALALLPTQDEMRAKLAGTLQAPIVGFVRVLNGNISGFVRVLQAVADQKAVA